MSVVVTLKPTTSFTIESLESFPRNSRSSPLSGVPTGLQLSGLLQSAPAEPVQVRSVPKAGNATTPASQAAQKAVLMVVASRLPRPARVAED